MSAMSRETPQGLALAGCLALGSSYENVKLSEMGGRFPLSLELMTLTMSAFGRVLYSSNGIIPRLA